MTQYSSREPFNDPYPNVWAGHSEYNQMRADTDMFRKGAPSNHISMDYRHRPRPEFYRPQTNPTNPILAKLRSLKSPHRANWIQGLMEQSEHVRFPNWNDNEVDHARRVLTRLANLKEES